MLLHETEHHSAIPIQFLSQRLSYDMTSTIKVTHFNKNVHNDRVKILLVFILSYDL